MIGMISLATNYCGKGINRQFLRIRAFKGAVSFDFDGYRSSIRRFEMVSPYLGH